MSHSKLFQDVNSPVCQSVYILCVYILLNEHKIIIVKTWAETVKGHQFFVEALKSNI